MKYIQFEIENYRGITEKVIIDLEKTSLIPLIGINECGKTTILQAIYCFDYVNDEEYQKKHLENILNLYKTLDDKEPTVTAIIEFNKSELINIINTNNNLEQAKMEEAKKTGKPYTGQIIDIDLMKNINSTRMHIKRNLKNLKYSIVDEQFSFLSNILKKIISHAPYILYNDDFMDRPPNFINIPETKPDSLTDWLAIYERLFQSNHHSLFQLTKIDDERRIMSIISDIEETLKNKLSRAWKTFLLSNHGSLNVKLNFNRAESKLEISIVEKTGNKERFFNVADRSKGFLWFFNFVMKLEFNAKIIGNTKDTIFLLDEPGSYLHSTAQEKLCKKIKDISEKEGNVIYCTHSHHLLNPDIIRLNQIYIVEKKNDKNITATPVTKMKMSREIIHAYQPILDALQVPAYNTLFTNDKIIFVEGIYDRYIIYMFCDIEQDINIIPGTSADSILKNIQLSIGFSKKYIAIWDNDEEGNEKYQKACKFFGGHESQFFDKLPLGSKRKRRMENMFENDDILKICKELSLPDNSSYEAIILELYYSKYKKKICESVSKETKGNFSILSTIIRKRFNYYQGE
jgi:predicted ATP-dependent endonuclease of OLD family